MLGGTGVCVLVCVVVCEVVSVFVSWSKSESVIVPCLPQTEGRGGKLCLLGFGGDWLITIKCVQVIL